MLPYTRQIVVFIQIFITYVSVCVTGNVKRYNLLWQKYIQQIKHLEKSVARSMSHCGKINVSEKTVEKSSVAKSCVAIS